MYTHDCMRTVRSSHNIVAAAKHRRAVDGQTLASRYEMGGDDNVMLARGGCW